MLARRPGGDWSAPPGVTFRDWIDCGTFAVPGRDGPTVDDLAYHLTTLFPPVRARGHLEVRYIDAQPGDWWRVPVAVLWAPVHRRRRRPGGRRGLRAAARTLARRRPVRHGRPGAGPGRDPGAGAGAGRAGPLAAGPQPPPRPSRPTSSTGPAGAAARATISAPAGPSARADDRPGGPAVLTDVPNTLPAAEEDLRTEIAARLDRARRRTALLTDAVDDGDLVRQHSRLMSPLVWDLAHIGNQEELWLLRDVGGREPMLPEAVDRLYDAFQHPRATGRRCRCWTRPSPGGTWRRSASACSTWSSARRFDGSPADRAAASSSA